MGKKKKQEKAKKHKEKEEKLLKAEKKAKRPKAEKDAPQKAKPAVRAADTAGESKHLTGEPLQNLAEAVPAAVFHALGDESRLRILDLLLEGELCVAQLQKSVTIVQSTLSHHLKILVEAGLVRMRRQGRWSYYSIDREKI